MFEVGPEVLVTDFVGYSRLELRRRELPKSRTRDQEDRTSMQHYARLWQFDDLCLEHILPFVVDENTLNAAEFGCFIRRRLQLAHSRKARKLATFLLGTYGYRPQ
jgi:hypothetical protein